MSKMILNGTGKILLLLLIVLSLAACGSSSNSTNDSVSATGDSRVFSADSNTVALHHFEEGSGAFLTDLVCDLTKSPKASFGSLCSFA